MIASQELTNILLLLRRRGGAPRMEDEPMLRWFAFAHLPPHLQPASSPFWDLACHIVATIERSPERTVALRKLLESKDAAVRAALPTT